MKTMKKVYQKPAMTVVQLQHQCNILSGSELTGTDGNAGLQYRGGGSGPARARSNGGIDWNDWDE